jgi:hypothetical protein
MKIKHEIPHCRDNFKFKYNQNRRKRLDRYPYHTNTWPPTFPSWHRHCKKTSFMDLILPSWWNEAVMRSLNLTIEHTLSDTVGIYSAFTFHIGRTVWIRVHNGRDCMVVGFISTYAIITNLVNSNPAWARCTLYNIMWCSLSVKCGRSVVFSMYSGLLLQ